MARQFIVILSTSILVVASLEGKVSAQEVDKLDGGYAVVVSKETYADPEWRKVADALVAKHDGKLLTIDGHIKRAVEPLRQALPRYTCFVAKSAEAGRDFVAEVHRLTRKLDADPYADTIWGILTGFDAQDAFRAATNDKPLLVTKIAAGTEVALEQCVEGVWYCELKQGRMVKKVKGSRPEQSQGPADTTAALADALNTYQADLFVTSGHATERDWQIGYSYPNGTFRSRTGRLFGMSRSGMKTPIASENPKVYLPIGNCLMGHIDGPDAMALAWMKSANVQQMAGYTVTTWYGYAGWGVLDYFVEQPGRYSLAEAFAANQYALIHRLTTYFPEIATLDPAPGESTRVPTISAEARAAGLTAQDAAGLLHDRDVLAFYGDPAWDARLADGEKAYEQTLTEANGVYTLTIKSLRGAKSFEPINTNGAQRGWRPIVQFLPHRIGKMEVIEGNDLNPVTADDFVLVPNPRTCDEDRAYVVKFKVL